MMLPTRISLDGTNLCDPSVSFAFTPWLESRYVLDDKVILLYVHGDHFLEDIPLFALHYDNFRSHMCAVDTELETPVFG